VMISALGIFFLSILAGQVARKAFFPSWRIETYSIYTCSFH
jgi:hypothetical protein